MDSINREQPEKNREDLQDKAALEKIKQLCEKAKTCFFCTHPGEGSAFSTRPMNLQEIDDEGSLWFLSASDSYKNAHIAQNPEVRLLFQGSTYADFLSIEGRAEVTRDADKIRALWNPLLKTWFTEGKDDPRITAIRIRPSGGYYWDTKHGQLVAFAKQLAGAVIGKTLDDSIEGTLTV